jgi:hypothetical protein
MAAVPATTRAPVHTEARRMRRPQGEKDVRTIPLLRGGDDADHVTRPGHVLFPEQLAAAGFLPLQLRLGRMDVALPGGIGCHWDVDGDVPDAPGLYAFTLRWPDRPQRHVMYVGQTGHLWMVTRGTLPRDGGARGGQRYGRPQHAGKTRQRINLDIAWAVRVGWLPQQWVRPMPGANKADLRAHEEWFISRWRLRAVGWNLR